MTRPDGLRGRRFGKSDAPVGSDVTGKLTGAGINARAVVALSEKRNHCAAGVACAGIVDDRLETIANFGPILVFERRYEQEDAAIVFFVADAELLEEFVAELLDGLSFEGADGNDCHLRAGFLLELGAEIFEARRGGRSDDVGEIGDVTGGMNVLDLFGRGNRDAHENKKNEKKERFENWRRKRRFGRGQQHARTTIGVARNLVKRGSTLGLAKQTPETLGLDREFLGKWIVRPLGVPKDADDPPALAVVEQLEAIDAARERSLTGGMARFVAAENLSNVAKGLDAIDDGAFEETVL